MQAVMSLDSLAPDAQSQSQSQPLARRAALTLHALGAADRAWLLAQLPTAQRERLQAMLGELEALGIPASRHLLQDLLSAAHVAPHPGAGAPLPVAAEVPLPSGGASLHQQQAALGRMDPVTIVRVLQTEPAGLIAQLLHVHPWPWRQAVLEQLGLVKRRRVEEFLDGLHRQVRPRAPDALHKALVAAVYRRAADAAGAPGPDVSVSQSGLRAAPSVASGRAASRPGWLRFWPKGRP